MEVWNMNLWAVDHGDGQEGWFEIAGLGEKLAVPKQDTEPGWSIFCMFTDTEIKLVKREE